MTREHIPRGLLEEVVIFERSAEGESGARTLAPDHSPRQPYVPPQPPLQSAGQSEIGASLQHRVEQFLFHQAELLDSKCWQEYIDLFADDGLYWMPVTADQTDWLDTPSIFIEDKPMMEVRKGRVIHPNAWSQAPLWGTSHLIGNVVIESQTDAKVCVRSRFQMIELRRDQQRQFAGSYRHTLVHVNGELRIAMQRVDLLNSQAVFDYVLQVWV